MNVLLVYPKYPDSFWSFRYALPFISKKAAVPPLGLITVSAMLPGSWNKKLVDMNVTRLKSSDLFWADYIFISAMYVQQESVNQVIEACHKLSTAKIVAGGPLFTQEHDNYPQIDYFILNEAEITLPLFLNDLNSNRQLKRIYQTNKNEFADLRLSPVPDYHLLSRKDYAFMNIQISRGCPFLCDFCEITALLGRRMRMKSSEQVIRELECLYKLNWRGPVSIVDDNFIGKKKIIKEDLLPALHLWMKKRNFPFSFNIQASINMADDVELLSQMVENRFNSAFIGIETPSEESLQDCNKSQNINRDLLHNVRKIQNAGLQVSGGFIVGFDSDTPSIFQQQIDFIQQSGIVSAMVGLLNAPKNTQLYRRLEAEGRLRTEASGNNTDFSINFNPKMSYSELLKGYRTIVQSIYAEKPYYRRVREFFRNYHPRKKQRKINLPNLKAFLRTIFVIGIVDHGRYEYWKFLLWTLFKHPQLFIDAVTFTVYGYHFRRVYGLRK